MHDAPPFRKLSTRNQTRIVFHGIDECTNREREKETILTSYCAAQRVASDAEMTSAAVQSRKSTRKIPESRRDRKNAPVTFENNAYNALSLPGIRVRHFHSDREQKLPALFQTRHSLNQTKRLREMKGPSHGVIFLLAP